MPNQERNNLIDDLARNADLQAVVEAHGGRVRRMGDKGLTRCPYHDDHDPSLNLYPAGNGGKPHFHCYSCGAHGDVFHLVQKLRGCDFLEALEWEARHQGKSLPAARRGKRAIGPDLSKEGLLRAWEIYRNQTLAERQWLEEWAERRGFRHDFLKSADIVAAKNNKLSRALQKNGTDRQELAELEAAELVNRFRFFKRETASGYLDLAYSTRDSLFGDRIIFTLRDLDRGLVGFAGRSLGTEATPREAKQGPKYLYSKGFKRAKTLYRGDKVAQRLRRLSNQPDAPERQRGSFDLYLCEGLMDALRLESLEFAAVAILGSRITGEQVTVLGKLAEMAEALDLFFVCHLFFDRDEAGAKGMVDALAMILNAAQDFSTWRVDVIWPAENASGKDPDELFNGSKNRSDADRKLAEWRIPAMQLIFAEALGCDPGRLDSESGFHEAARPIRLKAARNVQQRLKNNARVQDWKGFLARTEPFDTRWDEEPGDRPSWASWLENFLVGAPGARREKTSSYAETPESDLAKLGRATNLAYSSARRRELTVDEASWDRLRRVADVFDQFHIARLKAGRGEPLAPFDAVYVSRGPGKSEPRLKAMPGVEDLVLQQYLLLELLQDYPTAPAFFEAIPAVRFVRQSGTGCIRTTGIDNRNQPWIIGETVSFAYQVDMDVVEGLIEPRGEGMFRPYYDCWKDFIDYIARRIRRCQAPLLYVERLDIRRYYDHLPREVVQGRLVHPIRQALGSLSNHLACAPLFRDSLEVERRAEALVEWFCDQSFGYSYYDPESGEEKYSNALKGVPQGPDLSSYLANIALFPLDQAMSREIEQLDEAAREESGTGTGGVYARYVDDLVIVAPSAAALARLRALADQELRQIGLELTQKTDPIPPKTQSELLAWLVGHAKLDFSGPFAGPPAERSFNRFFPLIDAGAFSREGIDRRDALGLIHDSQLGSPSIDRDQVLRQLEIAFTADELRHGDRVQVAKRLWRCVAEDEDACRSPADLAQAFRQLWRKTQQAASLLADAEEAPAWEDPALIALEGLERFLASRPEYNPTLTSNERETVGCWRQRIARAVLTGLCQELPKRDNDSPKSWGKGINKLQYMLVVRIAAILWLATQVAGANRTHSLRPSRQWLSKLFSAVDAPASVRARLSVAEAFKDLDQLRVQGLWPNDQPKGVALCLHEAIVRLGIEGEDNVDPLEFIRSQAEEFEHVRDQSDFRVLESVITIISLWLPDHGESSNHDGPTIDSALARRALVGLSAAAEAFPIFDLLSRRIRLAAAGWSWPANETRVLPIPAGIGTPGLIGVRLSSGKGISAPSEIGVLKAPSEGESDIGVLERDFLPRLEWRQLTAKGKEKFVSLAAKWDTGGVICTEPPPPTAASDHKLLRWTADAFRELAEYSAEIRRTRYAGSRSETDQPMEPVAAWSTIVMPATPGVQRQADSTWQILGFLARSSDLGDRAFVRAGTKSLNPVTIPAAEAPLWRIGHALGDLLGRASDIKSLATLSLAPPAKELSDPATMECEAILRIALFRLRGGTVSGKPLRHRVGESLPVSLERILRLLERFPEGSSAEACHRRLAFLVATFTETHALRLRLDTPLRPEIPGVATGFVGSLYNAIFRPGQQLAQRLPKVDETDESRSLELALRRPVRALARLSQRMARLIVKDDIDAAFTISLKAAVASLHIATLTAGLRAVALDYWATLRDPDGMLVQIRNDPPDLELWNISSDALLVIDHSGLPTGDLEGIEGLLARLGAATHPQPGGRYGDLRNITPLGWLVVVGILSDTMRSGYQGPGLRDEEKTASIEQRLRELADRMTVATDGNEESEDLPWSGLRETIEVWAEADISDSLQTMIDLDDALRLTVHHQRSPRYQAVRGWAEPYEFLGSDGTRWALQPWQFHVAGLSGESREGHTERVQNSVTNQWDYFWSETWLGDQLVGVGLVQPAMASLADLQEIQSDDTIPRRSSKEIRADTTGPEEQGKPDDDKEPIKPAAKDEHDISEQSRTDKTKSISTSSPAGKKEAKELRECLKSLQRSTWGQRKRAKVPCHARIALVQWWVDDTYRHPLVDAGPWPNADWKEWTKFFGNDEFSNATVQLLKKAQTKGKEHKWQQQATGYVPKVPSWAEHRRRRILREVLRACKEFDVDMVLLPEYSTRPETVSWMAEQMRHHRYQFSVWGGTYRIPEAERNDESSHPWWSAVLSLIVPDAEDGKDTEKAIFRRTKKYPSVAAHEVFNPMLTPLKPLFDKSKVQPKVGFDPREFVMELICSEMFAAVNPANMYHLANELRSLATQFGTEPGGADWAKEKIKQDIVELATHCGFGGVREYWPRKSIIFVPAMTSRSADYAVFGQAAMLAAAITTVFCDAVAPPFGKGRSCFIGRDGWNPSPKDDSMLAMPEPSIYHSVIPGIFRPGRPTSGPLGEKEQAVVIADVDPHYMAEGKPRPQSLSNPLCLVAHLPIIEGCNLPNGNEVERGRHASSDEVIKVVDLLLEAIQNIEKNPKQLVGALKRLAKLATDGHWIEERAKAWERHHRAIPWKSQPLPTALDWLWVDLDVDGLTTNNRRPPLSVREAFPRIRVPSWTTPGLGGERLGKSSDEEDE